MEISWVGITFAVKNWAVQQLAAELLHEGITFAYNEPGTISQKGMSGGGMNIWQAWNKEQKEPWKIQAASHCRT